MKYLGLKVFLLGLLLSSVSFASERQFKCSGDGGATAKITLNENSLRMKVVFDRLGHNIKMEVVDGHATKQLYVEENNSKTTDYLLGEVSLQVYDKKVILTDDLGMDWDCTN